MACKQPNTSIFPAKANLTKHLYLFIRSFININWILASYPVMIVFGRKNKKVILTVLESAAKVELPNLLDDTASRIIVVQRGD